MLRITIEIESSNYSPEMGDLDQESTLRVASNEIYTFDNRGDHTGMRELKLAAALRTWLREARL